MRERILAVMEKNSRIDIKDLAILLGESEVAVANPREAWALTRSRSGFTSSARWRPCT